MDIRFEPNHDLREAVEALRAVNDQAVLSINPDYIRLYAEAEDCSGTILVPKEFCMAYSGTDSYKLALVKIKDFLQPDTVVSLKDMDMELILDYRQKPEPAYSASAKVEVAKFTGFEENTALEIQNSLKANGRKISTISVHNTGGFLSKRLVRSHYNGKRLSMLTSHIARYCTISFDTDKPLKIRYELSGLSIYFILSPIIAGIG